MIKQQAGERQGMGIREKKKACNEKVESPEELLGPSTLLMFLQEKRLVLQRQQISGRSLPHRQRSLLLPWNNDPERH